MSWLSGYQYRKSVIISGSAGAGSGYQVLLRVGESANADADFHLEGHALNFPNDIRFTAADGVTEFAHWLEKVEGVAPDRTAYFWVKVEDSLDVDVQIYCYYGQEGGASASDPATFDFYFHYSEGNLDKFDATTKKGDWVFQTDGLYSSDGADDVAFLRSVATFDPEKILECKSRNDTITGNYQIGFGTRFDTTSQLGLYSTVRQGANADHSIIVDGALYNATSFPKNSDWHVQKLRWASDIAEAWIDDSYYTYADVTKTGLPVVIGSNNHTHVWEWIRVRKYTDPEPSFSSAGAEETAVVYVSSSLSDSYKLLNFTARSTSDVYAILNFARNLVSDSYKIFNFAANLASDAYSIRTFTSRTLLDSYAILASIIVREVIVLNSKIARELNLTSQVIREVLLRSKLS